MEIFLIKWVSEYVFRYIFQNLCIHSSFKAIKMIWAIGCLSKSVSKEAIRHSPGGENYLIPLSLYDINFKAIYKGNKDVIYRIFQNNRLWGDLQGTLRYLFLDFGSQRYRFVALGIGVIYRSHDQNALISCQMPPNPFKNNSIAIL